MEREINNNISIEIEARQDIFNLIIENNTYDLSSRLRSNDDLGGYFGFPVKIKGQDFGCIIDTRRMNHRHNINNMKIFLHNGPSGKEITVSKFDAENIFKNFKGDIKDEPIMGYGNIHILLENLRYSDFD